MRINESTKTTVKELYKEGYSYREITYLTGVAISTISGIIRKAIEKNELPLREKSDGINRNDDGTVCCDAKTNRNCVYGSAYGEKMCRYNIVMFRGRDCSADHCDKFVQRDKKI